MNPVLLVENDADRQRLAVAARRDLPEDEVLVRIVDCVARDETTLTLPADPHAELVAVEPPRLLAGGLTELVSYVRVKRDLANAIEHTLLEGSPVSTRDIALLTHVGSAKARA